MTARPFARGTFRLRALVVLLFGAMVLAACEGGGTTDDEAAVDETADAAVGAAESDADVDEGATETMTEADESVEVEEVTLVLPFGFLIGFAPSLVAESAGFFDEQGLDVTIETATGSSQAVQQVLGGQALISRTGGPDHISAVANEEAPLLSVATISQRSPFEVISSGENPVESPEDFAGQSIGIVSPGGATEFLLNIMIAESGLSPDDVAAEVVGNAPGAFASVESGDIAAFIATSGTRSNLEFDDADISFFSTDEFAPVPGQVYVVDAENIEENGDVIRRFLAAIDQSLTFMLEEDDNFDQTIEFLSEYDIAALADVDRARVELEVQSVDWSAEDGTTLRNREDAWGEAQDLMVSGGIIDAPVDPDALYTNEFVDEVLEQQ